MRRTAGVLIVVAVLAALGGVALLRRGWLARSGGPALPTSGAPAPPIATSATPAPSAPASAPPAVKSEPPAAASGSADAGAPSGTGVSSTIVSCARAAMPNELRLTGTIRDFNDTHPDFEKAIADDRGAVRPLLGPDKTPVYAAGDSTTSTMHGQAAFAQWFHDLPSVNMKGPFTIALKRDGQSDVYRYENNQFFPVDGKLFGNQGRDHNFHFTYELHTQFRYTGGEFFRFAGDDDLWVFINGHLAIDLGGVHNKEVGEVSLDARAAEFGIKRCDVAPLDLFFAERHTTASEFAVETSLGLTVAGAPVQPTGSLTIASGIERVKASARSLEIVLDASGSMNLPLEGSTRWKTALDVLRTVLDKLPSSFNVAFRMYGHRYPSRSARSCTDSELIVPPGPLDKSRILAAMGAVRPRGDTPLVYSVLQTADDLSQAGGGSVIVITDGEESCGGRPAEAAERLKASGIGITVDIVGFTLAGKRVEQQLTRFAEATGGRYYTARDGEALGRALLLAATDTFEYSIVDGAGKEIAHGQADGTALALDPGEYQVVVHAAGSDLTEHVTIGAGTNTTLTVVRRADGFAISR